MELKVSAAIDLGIKIVATLIAVFGVWKFFSERAAAEHAARQERALSYIARYASDDLVSARGSLMEFWRAHPDFTAAVGGRAVTDRELMNFVRASYPRYDKKEDIDRSLHLLLIFFDEVRFCVQSNLCDGQITAAYFCMPATRHARAFGHFYELIGTEIGAPDLHNGLKSLVADCQSSRI